MTNPWKSFHTSKTESRRSSALGVSANASREGSRIHRACKRPGCQTTTPRGVCLPCWGQLSRRTRSDIVRTSSRITTDPDDDLARDLNAVAWGIAVREWSGLPCR